MEFVGRVESLWRYPVKSMAGEELSQAFIGFAGLYGDRFYSFVSSTARKRFPFFTGRDKETMLLYRPAYRYAERMLQPSNLLEAEAGATGLTPIYPDADDLMVDVRTPSGDLLAIDDPLLISSLCEGTADRYELKLLRSHRSMTDCRPISMFSVQTVRQLGEEAGIELDKRRFRANIYVDLESGVGFRENEFVDRRVQIGAKAVIAIVARDSRCKMITLDPNSAMANPEIMRTVARAHDGMAGIYGAVVAEGTVWPGDEVSLLG